MAEPVTLTVDAMGGDNAPDVVLEGAAMALSADPDLQIILCGPQEVVVPFASAHDRCAAQVTSEVIEMGEHPAQAVRSKKDSSIVVGCRLVKEGRAEGFFSAGSTGACLAAATLVMGRVKGVKRPALGQVIPRLRKPTLLVDVGANADCKPEYLVQFAQMGVIYMSKIMSVASPKGRSAQHRRGGDQGQRRCASMPTRLLAQRFPSSRAIARAVTFWRAFDVVVCDGFSGNVCLKTIEGTSKTLFKYLKDAFPLVA